MEGSRGLNPFVKITRVFWGLSPTSSDISQAGYVLNYAFAKMREERKILSGDKYIMVINSEIGAVKAYPLIFLTALCPCCSFWTT